MRRRVVLAPVAVAVLAAAGLLGGRYQVQRTATAPSSVTLPLIG